MDGIFIDLRLRVASAMMSKRAMSLGINIRKQLGIENG